MAIGYTYVVCTHVACICITFTFIIDDSLQLFPTSSYPNTMHLFKVYVDRHLRVLLMEEILHHLGCFFNPVNDGMNYQPQLDSRILSIKSIYILPISTIPVVFWWLFGAKASKLKARRDAPWHGALWWFSVGSCCGSVERWLFERWDVLLATMIGMRFPGGDSESKNLVQASL